MKTKQVHNLTDAISINHNWFNGWSLGRVWTHLQADLEQARDTLSEYDSSFNLTLHNTSVATEPGRREAPPHDANRVESLMKLMKANSGINCSGFCELVCFNLKRKLARYEKMANASASSGQLSKAGVETLKESKTIEANSKKDSRQQIHTAHALMEGAKVLESMAKTWADWLNSRDKVCLYCFLLL